MKKKSRKSLLTVLLFVLLSVVMTLPVQASKRTASTVSSKTTYKNSKEFMTVRGLDSKKRAVWKYVTKKISSYRAQQYKMCGPQG